MADETNKRVVLIAGATGAIGGALVRRQVKAGWAVHGFSRSQEKLNTLSGEVGAFQGHRADARKGAEVAAVVDRVIEAEGRLDAYVHCVGSIILKAVHQLTDEEWHQTIDLNLNSAFYAMRAAVKPMQKAKRGCMVFVSTVAAVSGVPNHEAIAAAKAGIDGLVRSAAATYANRGLRFNSVAPALVDTAMSQPILSSEQARAVSEKMNPMGHIGDPDEVASLLSWLISDDASWVNGQTWSIDGGMGILNQRPKI